MKNNNEQKQLFSKERVIAGISYAVIGTIIVLIVEYFRDLEFSFLRTLISFILFLIFGYFMSKKNDKKRID